MSIHIRQARPEDAESACAAVRRSIEQCCIEDHLGKPDRLDAWLKNKTPENFLGWIQNDKNYCAVVEDESRVVGFAMYSDGELRLCYIQPEVRFQGVGKALLQFIEMWAVKSGALKSGALITTLTLQLESTRTALAFYRRNGYESCGPVVDFVGMEGHPMSKRLTVPPTIEDTA